MPWEQPDWATGCFNRLPATHGSRNYIRGKLSAWYPPASPMTSLPISPYFFFFFFIFCSICSLNCLCLLQLNRNGLVPAVLLCLSHTSTLCSGFFGLFPWLPVARAAHGMLQPCHLAGVPWKFSARPHSRRLTCLCLSTGLQLMPSKALKLLV